MEEISRKYIMHLVKRVYQALLAEFNDSRTIKFYINKWHEHDDFNWENFSIIIENGEFYLEETLHSMNGQTLLQIAVDLGIETPDFIPSIATFRNEIKSDYKTASGTFEKAFKHIETHPDIAIGLANSALESIIKEIFKDEKIKTKPKEGKTLYDLTAELLKEFQLFPNSGMPSEIKTIGSSLLAINQSIEKLRSTNTEFHGKVNSDYIIGDSLYTYFVVNVVSTIGLFLKSFYEKKFAKMKISTPEINEIDDLPF